MRTKQSKANREARAAGKARQVRSSALGKLLIMLAVVAAIVFGVAIFFKVNTIEIQGNTVYPPTRSSRPRRSSRAIIS